MPKSDMHKKLGNQKKIKWNLKRNHPYQFGENSNSG